MSLARWLDIRKIYKYSIYMSVYTEKLKDLNKLSKLKSLASAHKIGAHKIKEFIKVARYKENIQIFISRY